MKARVLDLHVHDALTELDFDHISSHIPRLIGTGDSEVSITATLF